MRSSFFLRASCLLYGIHGGAGFDVLRRAGARSRVAMSAAAGGDWRIPEHVKRIVLVRHGAVDRAAGQIKDGAYYGGNVDLPLSADGEAEAFRAAAYVTEDLNLAAADVGAVWSSPMRRAVFGAERVRDAVFGSQPCEVGKDEGFREIDRGVWTNRTVAEIEADPALGGDGAIDRFLSDIHKGGKPSQGESLIDVRNRAVAAFQQRVLPSVDVGKAGVVVSHLWVTRSILTHMLGSDDFGALDVPTASVSVVDIACDADTGLPLVCDAGRLKGEVLLVGTKP